MSCVDEDVVVIAERQAVEVAVQIENHVSVDIDEVVALALLEVNEALLLHRCPSNKLLTMY